MRKACLNAITELARQDDRIVFIGSDLGAGVMEDFKREMPDRFYMEGIGEQNIVGMATGLALSGKIVYVHTIATFLLRRAFEFVCLGPGLHQANVRLIGAGGNGSTYAPLGPTHLATDDIGLARMIPGMRILSPCDAQEMDELMPQTTEYHGPIYIRLGKGGDPPVTRAWPAQMGMPQFVVEGSSLLLMSTGTTTQIAVEAARALGASVVHVNSFPIDDLHFWVDGRPAIITIEDHQGSGGLGTVVAEALSETGSSCVLKRIGYPSCFPSGYGTQDQLRARYGISVSNIVRVAKELCGATA